MNQYLLSTYAGSADQPPTPPSPEEMQQFLQRVAAVEDAMDADGAFVFGGALTEPRDARTIRPEGQELLTTDGPFIETKEMIAGFYIINAPDMAAATRWAERVVSAIGRPIEVREFRATGRVRA